MFREEPDQATLGQITVNQPVSQDCHAKPHQGRTAQCQRIGEHKIADYGYLEDIRLVSVQATTGDPKTVEMLANKALADLTEAML